MRIFHLGWDIPWFAKRHDSEGVQIIEHMPNKSQYVGTDNLHFVQLRLFGAVILHSIHGPGC